MLFTTYSYFTFLLVAVAVHWALPSSGVRNVWLILCSLIFYSLTQGLFVFLLLAYVGFNWFAGIQLAARPNRGRMLWLVLGANIIPLVYYKYWLAFAGTSARSGPTTVSQFAIPLGISFFAFQASAYVIDVARGGAPIASIVDFTLFKTFWAGLVAGPIVRASEIRQQLRERAWDGPTALRGCGRIVDGLAKKIVLSDLVAPIANQAFQAAHPTFLDATFGTLAFGLQIYFDFSAYSDIAIGSAMLVGFHFPENFNWPYASRSPQEFWQRWHMTLSRWIRDYVFMPLSIHYRRNPLLSRTSIVLAMALCGVWHGAGWTFLVWGLWHGVLLALNATSLRSFFSPVESTRAQRFLSFIATFLLVQAGWIFFRAESVTQGVDFLRAIVTVRGGLQRAAVRENGILVVSMLWTAMLVAQHARDALHAGIKAFNWRVAMPPLRAVQLALVIVMHQNATSFVYFQF